MSSFFVYGYVHACVGKSIENNFTEKGYSMAFNPKVSVWLFIFKFNWISFFLCAMVLGREHHMVRSLTMWIILR